MRPRSPNPSCFDSRDDYLEAISDYERREAAREQMADEAYDCSGDDWPDPYKLQEW